MAQTSTYLNSTTKLLIEVLIQYNRAVTVSKQEGVGPTTISFCQHGKKTD